MIELKGLCKSFEEKEVLTDINATFENGKTNLIIGQSGSGKDRTDEMHCRPADPRKGEYYTTTAISSQWERKRRKRCAAKWE